MLSLQVLYFLTLLFQPVFFSYFACPFHLSINLIVTLGVIRFSIMSSMSVLIQGFFVFLHNLWQYTVCCLLYTLFYVRPYDIHSILFIFLFCYLMFKTVKERYCLLQLRIATSYVHLSALSRLNCSMFSFFFVLFRFILTVSTTGL